MVMTGRSGASGEYRYGFNSMEKDDEIKTVKGSSYDFGARIYDSRVGRFLSLDPLTTDFPWESPYVAFANNPIIFNDPTGEAPNPAQVKRRTDRLQKRVDRKYGKSTYSSNAVFLYKSQRKYFGGIGLSRGKNEQPSLTVNKRKGNNSTGWNFTLPEKGEPYVSDRFRIKGDFSPYPNGSKKKTLISEDWEKSKVLNLDLDNNGGSIYIRSEVLSGFKLEMKITYQNGDIVTTEIVDSPQTLPSGTYDRDKDVPHVFAKNGTYHRYENSSDNPIVKFEIVVRPTKEGTIVHDSGYLQPGKLVKATVSVKKKK